MSNKLKYTKAFTVLIATAIFITGCTDKREAKLPYDARESIFSISELDTLNGKSEILLNTDSELSEMSLADSSKAVAENSLVAVKKTKAPERLRFMFKELQITGTPSKQYKVAVSVDQQYVTAYKVISSHQELSTLEKQIAQTKEEINLQKDIQKTVSTTTAKPLVSKLTTVRKGKFEKKWSEQEVAYVPLFRFKVARYGKLERAKNGLDESTATLQLKDSSWSKATHVQVSTEIKDRIAFGITEDMNRTFVMNSINNKVLTAKTLNDDFKIPLALDEKTKVLTLLDVKAMHVFEIGQMDKMILTDSQKNQLKMNDGKANVRKCSADLVKILPKDEQEGCIIVLRYDVPVTYVATELPEADVNGKINSDIKIKEVPASKNVGLVKIAENVQATKVEADQKMDPRTTIKVADIKGKEFFFKRTLEDAPVTTAFPPGMAGELTIVKFELLENRMAVVKADSVANYKYGNTAADVEELMSIPVKYLKYESQDASGNKYSMPVLTEASRNDAEYIELNWTANTLSTAYSPYATVHESCIIAAGSQTVSDVNMKLDTGVLNFSIDYSTSLHPYCIEVNSSAESYNGGSGYTTNARLKERISFKLNDKSTDKSYVAAIPFSAQNKLGYGVWTTGTQNPTETGLLGRTGQEINNQVLHDFRNGKVLHYTVTGLEPSADIEPEIKKMYIETAREVVDAWNFAYEQVFKNQKDYQRSGRYVTVDFSGYDGVDARVGDLDKNIIHFENKFNGNHGVLGVSQVGYNPRSGIVVSDALVIYAGNLQQSIAATQRNFKLQDAWNSVKKQQKEKLIAALVESEKNQATPAQAQQIANDKSASSELKVSTAIQVTQQLAKTALSLDKTQIKQLAGKSLKNTNNLAMSQMIQTMKSLGGAKNIDYASPNSAAGWMDKVFKAINKNPSIDQEELEGVIAKEMLVTLGNKLSQTEKNELTYISKSTEVRTKLKSHFANKPGCFLMDIPQNAAKFANKPFIQALKQVLYFDLAHEMGHSQGLTHNFIGSFDKANFGNANGKESKKNYSSVMDYFQYEDFNWDGIGRYDIHALRASHLGLLEAIDSTAETPKYLSISSIKDKYAANGWHNFSKNSTKQLLRPYKYCTDIDVAYEPTCQRFDSGTTANEIIDNLITSYESIYDTSYYSWNRNSFSYRSAAGARSYAISKMYSMRQFMDEYFYQRFYNSKDTAAIQDLGTAALKVYYFFNNVIRTPDKSVSFGDLKKFDIVKYNYRDVDPKTGQPTGEEKQDYQLIENRSLDSFTIDQKRVDTVGYEFNKVAALNLLSMKYFPHYKYLGNSITFSFLDFEKYAMGVSTEESLYVDAVIGILLDQMQASVATDKVPMLSTSQKLTASDTLRSYAAIYSILNLEASTLREADNNANLFKVGTSIGSAPTDRIALNNLGVNANSSRKVNYFAADGGLVSDLVVNVASRKAFGIKLATDMNINLQKLAYAQLINITSGGKKAADVATAKQAVLKQAQELNKDGNIVSKEMIAENPDITLEKQVNMIEILNQNILSASFGLMTEDKKSAEEAQKMAIELLNNMKVLEAQFPLIAANSKALSAAISTVATKSAGTAGEQMMANLSSIVSQIVDGTQNEISYGIIMKNLDFLARITEVTNPELSRQ